MNAKDKELIEELNNVVMIPRWFHRYCTIKNKDFQTRNGYYKELKDILLNVCKNTNNDTAPNNTIIKNLYFNDKSIRQAISSISTLLLCMPEQNEKEVIEQLRKCYCFLKNKLQKKLEENDL